MAELATGRSLPTSFICGTGFIQCIPSTRAALASRSSSLSPNRGALVAAAAILEMLMLDVLVARIVEGSQISAREEKMDCLTSSLSETAFE